MILANSGFVNVLLMRTDRDYFNCFTPMHSILVSAPAAVREIRQVLEKRFPSTIFAVRLEDPTLDSKDLRGVDVVWTSGPSREEVEDVLDIFQGVRWDPRSGELDSRSHFMVSPGGELVEVFYNVDYIFCNGPSASVLES